MLDGGFLGRVFAAVGLVQDGALGGRGALESLIDEPRAFVVQDVGADLADGFGAAVGVEVVVLDLEVFAQRDQDVAGLTQVQVRGQLEIVQRERDGQVEAVEGGFVDDDELMLAERELAQVDVVLGRREQVA